MKPARSGERWTIAEDHRLLRLLREEIARAPGVSVFSYGPETPASIVADKLERTPAAIMARWQILRVAEEHARAGRGDEAWPDCLPPMFPGAN